MKKLVMTTMVMALLAGAPGSAGTQSLYKVSQSPFSTYIAQKVGDLLTIVVTESVIVNDNGTNNVNKESTLNAELESLFLPHFDLSKGFTTAMGGGDPPQFGFHNKSTQTGQATINATHNITTKLQVRLIEIVREGEFVVRGERTININGRLKKVFISGVIRQRDITADNTVDSDKLADARIEIEGDVAHEIKPGFITDIFNKIF